MHLSLLHDAGELPDPQPPHYVPLPQDYAALEGEDWGDVTGFAAPAEA